MKTNLSLKRTVACLMTIAMFFGILPILTFGAEVSSGFEIAKAEYTKDNKIAVTVTMGTDLLDKDGKVLIALYDKDNKLLSCKTSNPAWQLSLTFDRLNNYCGKYTAKAFYFGSLATIKPLCNAASKELEGKHISDKCSLWLFKECLACRMMLFAGHCLTDEWIKDENYHVRICECGQGCFASEAHTYCTPVTSGTETLYKCVCGMTSETQSHSFPDNWIQSDTGGHYRLCLLCGEKEEELWHDDLVDHRCTKCGYKVIEEESTGGNGSGVINPGGGTVVIPTHDCGHKMTELMLSDHSQCEHCNGYKCDGRDHSCCEICGEYKCNGNIHVICKRCPNYLCTNADHSSCASHGLEYALNTDGTYEVFGIGTCTDTDIIIPKEYDGKPVTSLKGALFFDNKAITSVVLPNSITSIGASAFWSCSNLEYIVMPKNMTSIGERTFSGCKKLKSITVPNGVTTIEFATFVDCEALSDISIPKSVTEIENHVIDKDHVVIHYGGTKSQWEAISKNNWNTRGYLLNRDATYCAQIICTDGVLDSGHVKCSKCGNNLCDGSDHDH